MRVEQGEGNESAGWPRLVRIYERKEPTCRRKIWNHADGMLRVYADRRTAINVQQTIDPWVEATLLTTLVVAFWLIARHVPAMADDWAWGSKLGTDRLQTWFSGYNGRYMGNVVVILMTRMGWFTPILQGVGLALMIGIILDMTHNRTILVM